MDARPVNDACFSACRYPNTRRGLDLIIREIATRIFRPWIAGESPCAGTAVAATDRPMGAFGATPLQRSRFLFQAGHQGFTGILPDL